MHQELVERRRWIDEARFLHAFNYCTLLPGPEAQQLAIYIGWLMHKTKGGLVAGILFVFPGFLAMLALSALYAGYGDLAPIRALFFGLKAAVLAIVVEAVLRIGKRALKSRLLIGIAAAAFIAIFFLEAPFPFIVFGAGLLGLICARYLPVAVRAPTELEGHASDTVIDQMAASGELRHTEPSTTRGLRVAVTCLALWATPLGMLAWVFGWSSVFIEQGIFFSKTAVVTFGGAYAVLAYVAQRAVETYGWLQPGEMVDGLGLAETTPGPLIMVVEFVAFLGAYRQPGTLPPMLAGVLGAAITVWVTFVPCFLWIFVGAPYIEALRKHRSLAAALAAITAAVVGVILNLSLWFALHVVFHEVGELRLGPVRVLLPALASIDAAALLLAIAAMVAMLGFKVKLPATLAGSALLGAAWKLLS